MVFKETEILAKKLKRYKENHIPITQVSYRILGRGYFSTSLFAGYKYTEIEGRGSHLK